MSDVLITNKTRAGIDWLKPEWLPVKMEVGRAAKEHIKKFGDQYGWFNKPVKGSLADRVRDKFRYAEKMFTEYSTHKGDFAQALADRGRYCFPPEFGGKDELKPLMQEQFQATIDLVVKQKTIYIDDVWGAQERMLRAEVKGLPGVYILACLEKGERGYVGVGDEARAVLGHLDTPYRFVRFLATETWGEARRLEKIIHHNLANMTGVSKPKGNATRGQYLCEQGFLNAVQKAYEPSFAFYNTHGWV